MSSLHDIVTLQNIDDEDFIFEYDRASGNPAYVIPAGEVKRFPRFLAGHAVKHLVDRILTKRKIKTNNQEARLAVASQIIINEETFQQVPVLTEAEKTQKEVEMLNKPSELESILKKRQGEQVIDKPVEESKEEPIPDEKFEGLGKTVDTTVKPEPEPEVKPKPTKSELINYAAKQGLDLDSPDKEGKTLRQNLTKMTVDQAIESLAYPMD